MDKILILDFGSQVTQLIARRVREAHVYCELHPYDMSIEDIRAFNPKGIILSGGPNSVYESDYQADPALFDLGVPVFGICYGMQFMAHTLGGAVEAGDQREFGYAEIRARNHSKLLEGLQDRSNDAGHGLLDVWMSHGDKVTTLPDGFKVIAETPSCPIAAMADETRHYYGVQFHPEVTHTRRGTEMIHRFVLHICGAEPSWTMPNYIDEAVKKIREQVGDEEVILGLSGGVDSSVAAALIHRAIGDQLTCIHVNNGLMRTGESASVLRFFREKTRLNVIDVDATDFFLTALAGVTEPEEKRKRIGYGFIEIFEAEANKIGTVRYLAQGTLYPDVIESVVFRGKAPIKSHHNVGGLPERMQLDLIEPLRELFKDEVRELGLELGLPEEAIYRQPFPGPGLGIRIMGEVNAERLRILRQADVIVLEEMKDSGWYRKVWQSFAVLLPIQTVGVMGDGRTYEHVIALRAVDSRDAMTADWSRLPYDLLGRISNRIINEVRGVNRVVYDISSKPPATIEWE